MTAPRTFPRIEELRVANYRVLQNVNLRNLTPLTVFIGPNGSGKSTILDVFSFLAECFQLGLRSAWERRGRGRELKSRGQDGSIEFELTYREQPQSEPIRYALKINEKQGSPVVENEILFLPASSDDQEKKIVDYEHGQGYVRTIDASGNGDRFENVPLRSADLIAVGALGQLASHPRVAALREFITGWHLSHLLVPDTHSEPEAGLHEHLSPSGNNVANVVQHLARNYPEQLAQIIRTLGSRVPRLDRILTEEMADGRLLLQLKDSPFKQPILAKFASDGTLKLLAYLLLLHDPLPPPLIGVEEPENYLHPRLLYSLAEDFRDASARSQVLITTHSPYFADALQPDEVRVLYRDEDGYALVERVTDLPGVRQFIEAGGVLGDLWMEGHFNVGDPLSNAGMPRAAAVR